MNSSRPFWLAMLERFTASTLLVLLFPLLLFVSLLIYVWAGSPVVLADFVPTRDGAFAQSYRFRTTGAGKPGFHLLGRLVRRYGVDDTLGLWSVASGDITFREFFRSLRRR